MTRSSRRKRLIAACVVLAAGVCAQLQAQDVSLEYRLKAAYLFNFTRFVDWPSTASGLPALTICVASHNPFGQTLAEIVRDERVNDRPLQTRVVRQPGGCDVLFVPLSVPHEPYLRAARGRPVLTVGETPEFLRDGGIINFLLEEGKVRFEIDREAAARANLAISSRLLRLARAAVSGMTPHKWQAE